MTGCGWHTGPGPVEGWAIGAVEGQTVEPGLRAAVRDALVREVRARGMAPRGPTVEVELLDVSHDPEATIPSGTAAWTAGVSLRLSVPGRDGCEVVVDGRRTWTAAPDAPAAAMPARADAIEDLAFELASRGLDGLLASESCR